jgi:hypothetical protein
MDERLFNGRRCMDDPNPKPECSPVPAKLKKAIEDALDAEYHGTVGPLPIATTHVKFNNLDKVNLIVSNELGIKPLKPNP